MSVFMQEIVQICYRRTFCLSLFTISNFNLAFPSIPILYFFSNPFWKIELWPPCYFIFSEFTTGPQNFRTRAGRSYGKENLEIVLRSQGNWVQRWNSELKASSTIKKQTQKQTQTDS